MQVKNKIAVIAEVSLFSVLAAILGLVESILPLQLIIPVPGVKLGIANVIIVIAIFKSGAASAFAVVILRTLLAFIFSGNPVSFLISLSGGLLSFICLLVMIKLYNNTFTFIGISSSCAVCHGIGQLTAAYFTVGEAVLYYLPVLCFFCSLTGIFTGTLLNILIHKMTLFKKGEL